MKNLLTEAVNNYNVSKEHVNAGIVQYSSDANTRASFGGNKANLMRVLDQLKTISGQRNVINALRHIHENTLSKSPRRPDAKRAVFVFVGGTVATMGKSDLGAMANIYRNAGIDLFFILYGPQQERKNFDTLTGNQDKVIQYDSHYMLPYAIHPLLTLKGMKQGKFDIAVMRGQRYCQLLLPVFT